MFENFELRYSSASFKYRCQLLTESEVSQMEWLANHVPLTNLANRRLRSQVESAPIATDLYESDRHLAVHLDLDGFKSVDDTYGHDIGDELLKHVSERITEQSKEEDLGLKRFGRWQDSGSYLFSYPSNLLTL